MEHCDGFSETVTLEQGVNGTQPQQNVVTVEESHIANTNMAAMEYSYYGTMSH